MKNSNQIRINYISNKSNVFLIILLLFATMFTVNNLYANKYNYTKNNNLSLSYINIGSYVNSSKLKNIIKTKSTTLTKKETKVIACKDIILTLPVITIKDNDLAILIKNGGLCSDLITIIGNGKTTIDGTISSTLTRGKEKTYIATDGNWIVKEKEIVNENEYEVSLTGSWTTIPEVIQFLKLHMKAASVIKLDKGDYNISSTQVINLPYSLTFEGLSFGATKLKASVGLNGSPMFRCLSDCYFKMLTFDGTTLINYGSNPGEDAIRLLGSGTYNEIKDCNFDHFYNTIIDSTNAAIWLFQCDVSNAHNNGVLIHGNTPGVRVRIAQTDFIKCNKSVNMDKGSNAIVQLNLGSYYNENVTDSAIIYNPIGFSFSTMIISNNAWNNVGKLISGFDFSRQDKRDLNAYVENNDGYENENPHSKINVLFNTIATTVTTAGTWEKANFTCANIYLVDFGLSGNHLTYLSSQENKGVMNISGNMVCSNDSITFSVALVKNGEIEKKYGETSVNVVDHNIEYQWFMNIFMESMSQNDYYEIWITSNKNNDVYVLQDVQWFCNTQ